MVTTDGDGNASFSTTFVGNISEGYYATATATDPDDNTSEFSQCRVVADHCFPVQDVSFGWTPALPIVDQVVTFTSTASGTAPITFTWDLGDGSTGSGAVVQHTYTTAGDYSVVVTATNCTGASVVTQTHTVTILEPPCDPAQDALR
jgi:PKD repeat protein